MLSAVAILDEAQERAAFTDPEPHLHVNLERLVDALNREGALTPLGAASARKGLTDRSVNRLNGLRFLRDFPEIADEKIEAPVFLTGLPRSGTTYFHYLFDRDPRFRIIRTWESIAPSPPPGFAPDSIAGRKAQEQQRRAAARPKNVEGFDALHLIDVDGPDECHVFMEQSYSAAGFMNLYDVPSYFEHMRSALDFDAAYQVHKRQLQLLQWRTPQPRWAVKYPNHVLAMPSIMKAHPSARIVMTHRDPVQTLASIAKMTLMLRGTRYDRVDPHRVGQQMLTFIAHHIARIMEFCTSPAGADVIHVDYYRVVDNPAAVMAEVHAALGIESPNEVQTAVADWRAKNPKGARGANPYALEQFGLDAAAVADRFSAYMRHFDIPREAEGLKRASA